MKRSIRNICMTLVLGVTVTPALVFAQVPDTIGALAEPYEPAAHVQRYDLSGPRAGMTFTPDGKARSQFGWHFEHQAASERQGPWFIVETIVLAGGVENQRLIPNGTMVFGMRLPNGYEFGIGPSVTLGGPKFLHSSLVIAAGRSFHVGGIDIPLNVALATDKDGARVTLVSGWAIRDTEVARP